jgi:hypothetical protein
MIRIKIISDNFYSHIELSIGIKQSDKVSGLGKVLFSEYSGTSSIAGVRRGNYHKMLERTL